jgi:hypothetical protein
LSCLTKPGALAGLFSSPEQPFRRTRAHNADHARLEFFLLLLDNLLQPRHSGHVGTARIDSRRERD